MTKMLVGLAGYAGSGKSTLAKGLQNYQRLSFAAALKDQVTLMLSAIGIDVNFNDSEQKEKYRDLLVFWGAFKRREDPDYWIKQLYMRNASVFAQDGHRVVIDDVRYPNEARWIKGKGGNVIFIERPGINAANKEEWNSLNALKVIGDIFFINNDDEIQEAVKLIRKTVMASLTTKPKAR